MALETPSTLAKECGAGKFANLYFLYGHDVGSLEAFAKKLINRLVPDDAQMMNYHKFDAKEFDCPAFADATQALPMFSDKILAVIQGFNAEKMLKEDLEAIKTLVCDLPETTYVIICADGENVFKNKRNLTDKNKKFYDMCAKIGTACDFVYKRSSDVAKLVVTALEKRDCLVSRADAEYLANLCLCDMSLIQNEIDKLSAYANGGQISREDINALCSGKIESDGFALALNILNRNADMVFHRIAELSAQEYEPIEIVGTIAFSITDIYRAKLTRSSGRQVSDAVKDFKYPPFRKFAIENAYRDCGRISIQHIREVLKILGDTDLLLKTKSSGKKGDFLILEQGITRCLALQI